MTSIRSPSRCCATELDAIAQEMQDALVRSAYSNIIKEGHDCSAALFDSSANIVAQATALPAQLGVLPTAVRRVVECFAQHQIRDGDVFVLNDPYDGGTHLPDIALVAPVMVDRAAVAFAACIAHHQDVGGKTPGSLPTEFSRHFPGRTAHPAAQAIRWRRARCGVACADRAQCPHSRYRARRPSRATGCAACRHDPARYAVW